MLLYYLKNPKQTGTLCSSSKRLSHVITENVALECASNIIEIGPGMGVFTQAILNKKASDAKLFVVEINPKIVENLHHKFPHLDIAEGSAEFLAQMMAERNMSSADVIISGIPWALLGVREQTKILKSIYNALSVGGYFATFAYRLPTPGARRFRKLLCKMMFSEIEVSKNVWQNIPPAFVYYCKK